MAGVTGNLFGPTVDTGSAVDLVIPAYNEQQNIGVLLEALPWSQLRHVIVVDNGSTDETSPIARAAGATVIDEPQRGYGMACQRALAWIREREPAPHILAFIDADLSDDPGLLPALCAPIARDEADLVIASRVKRAEPGALTLSQRVGNSVACTLIRLLTGRRYTDLGPMRAVRWSGLDQMAMQDTNWGWTVEMQYKAAVMGLRSVELTVPYRRRRAGVSKISGSIRGSIKAGSKIIATIFRLWWRYRK